MTDSTDSRWWVVVVGLRQSQTDDEGTTALEGTTARWWVMVVGLRQSLTDDEVRAPPP